ncbi:hypothetical protein ACQP00_16075 [Dactylosporangium sp. CS-047395]|uniref:hypothetical protein n=1 Tax=Dactylosporangium sp. CS-047395 TaxID=3239936 RepID=UPI003D8C5B41
MATEVIGLRRRWRQKLIVWARRYVPAEIAGTVCAFIGTAVIYGLFTDRVLAAVAGTVGEIVGFYGLIATVEWRRERARGYGLRRTTTSTARLLLAEFGVIEVLDSTILRPFFMYLGPGLTGGMGSGTLLGKLMADVAFYGVAIVSYELIRRRRKERAGAEEDTVELTRRVEDEITQPIPLQPGAARIPAQRKAGPRAKARKGLPGRTVRSSA